MTMALGYYVEGSLKRQEITRVNKKHRKFNLGHRPQLYPRALHAQ